MITKLHKISIKMKTSHLNDFMKFVKSTHELVYYAGGLSFVMMLILFMCIGFEYMENTIGMNKIVVWIVAIFSMYFVLGKYIEMRVSWLRGSQSNRSVQE